MNTLKFKILLSAVCFILTSSLFAQLSEDFEGASFPPSDWAVFDNGIGTAVGWTTVAGQGYAGSKAAYLSRENVVDGTLAQDWLVSPLITLNPDKAFSFYTKLTQGGIQGSTFSIRVSTTSQTDINSFITIATWNESTLMNGITTTEQITYIQKGIDLTSFGVQDVFIAFVMENDNGDRWLIDDISFVDKCLPPSQLSFENTSATSANLQWTETGTANEWEIEVLPINSNTNGVGNKTSINSFNVTNLTPNAWYKFYVRSICQGNPGGDITSEWIGPKEFQAIPTCPIPLIAQINDYNGYEADINWVVSSNGSQPTSWEVLIQPSGTGITSNSSGIIVNQPNFFATNLDPDVIYEVYVKSICDNNNFSEWSDQKLINNNTGGCIGEYNSTEVVSDLFRKLLNHLRQKVNNNEVIPNGYVCPELTNLEGHITDANPKIYNFNPVDFSFSFHPISSNDSNPDVKINNWLNTDNPIIDQIYINNNFIDASGYTYLHNNITLSDNSKITLAKVKHINFCSNCLTGEIQSSSELCINRPIEFTFDTLETNLIYDWTFYDLDGTTPLFNSNQSNPIVNYLTSGSYIVKLLVDNQVKKCKVEFITTFHLKDCTNCERHIAIVVDESGSIDEKEANKIRAQLKSFINKQASDNDILGTNVFVSLIGLSNSDINNRTDHIINQHINNSNKQQFLDWISGYRTNRVSPNSDYWNSGLNKALETNPDFVILITDGCQTNSASDLATTMQSFNNNNGATTGGAGKPHLFVVGIEDGFYVDSDTSSARKSILTKEEDPNLNPELSRTSSATARVSSFLRTSLKYLMSYTNSTFPSNDKYSFLADYYGTNDFNFFYDEPNYLSNGLIAKSFSVANGETTLIDPVDMSCGNMIPLEGCNDCLNFKPEEGKKYIISAWVKEEINKQVISYTNPTIQIKYLDNSDPKIEIGTEYCITSGDIIDGWQRIFKQITIPENTAYIQIALVNNSTSIPVYFDDVRIHPMDGSMKSFVYDPETFRLMAELDENNYSTFYEYDKEGGLVRVKKETSRGVKTIQETRSGNVIKQE